jgi:hypothetical protein
LYLENHCTSAVTKPPGSNHSSLVYLIPRGYNVSSTQTFLMGDILMLRSGLQFDLGYRISKSQKTITKARWIHGGTKKDGTYW